MSSNICYFRYFIFSSADFEIFIGNTISFTSLEEFSFLQLDGKLTRFLSADSL